MVLAFLISILGAVVHFLDTHFVSHVNIDRLAASYGAAHSCCNQTSGGPKKGGKAALKLQIKAPGISTYEIEVPAPKHMHHVLLPVKILKMLLPIAGVGMFLLALALQAQNFCLQPGELCCLVGVASMATGIG